MEALLILLWQISRQSLRAHALGDYDLATAFGGKKLFLTNNFP
jgi:hypothetical protein